MSRSPLFLHPCKHILRTELCWSGLNSDWRMTQSLRCSEQNIRIFGHYRMRLYTAIYIYIYICIYVFVSRYIIIMRSIPHAVHTAFYKLSVEATGVRKLKNHKCEKNTLFLKSKR